MAEAAILYLMLEATFLAEMFPWGVLLCAHSHVFIHWYTFNVQVHVVYIDVQD